MSRESFLFENAEAAMQFYELCEELQANTYAKRMAVLRLMVKNKKAVYLRDGEAYAKDKKVLKISLKRNNPNV